MAWRPTTRLAGSRLRATWTWGRIVALQQETRQGIAKTSVAMTDDNGAFDERALGRLSAVGGDALVLRMIDLFKQQVPERLRNAKEALSRQDWQAAERHMHSLKSSAANLGAAHVRRLAIAAETAAVKRDEGALGSLLESLESAYAEVEVLLVAEAARRSP